MIKERSNGNNEKKVTRIPGRRSSKPLMEKKRRARINTCLDILKSYVLKDTTENIKTSSVGETIETDEQNIEQLLITELKNNKKTILKDSNLANKGRRNPNKLEKADILELTVDYVRRLHHQRDQLQQENRSHQHMTPHRDINIMHHHTTNHNIIMNDNDNNDLSKNDNVSLTLHIEQSIKIPDLSQHHQQQQQQTTTTTTTNCLLHSQTRLPLMVTRSNNSCDQAPPSPPISSASSSPSPNGHNYISSTTADDQQQYNDHQEEEEEEDGPISMVVCDNSRLRGRGLHKPWRPWDALY